jgi:hypothetical protein
LALLSEKLSLVCKYIGFVYWNCTASPDAALLDSVSVVFSPPFRIPRIPARELPEL